MSFVFQSPMVPQRLLYMDHPETGQEVKVQFNKGLVVLEDEALADAIEAVEVPGVFRIPDEEAEALLAKPEPPPRPAAHRGALHTEVMQANMGAQMGNPERREEVEQVIIEETEKLQDAAGVEPNPVPIIPSTATLPSYMRHFDNG